MTGWFGPNALWLLLSPFAGRLPGEQARDLSQRGDCRTVEFWGFCANIHNPQDVEPEKTHSEWGNDSISAKRPA